MVTQASNGLAHQAPLGEASGTGAKRTKPPAQAPKRHAPTSAMGQRVGSLEEPTTFKLQHAFQGAGADA